jgi:hypothetical protein
MNEGMSYGPAIILWELYICFHYIFVIPNLFQICLMLSYLDITKIQNHNKPKRGGNPARSSENSIKYLNRRGTRTQTRSVQDHKY